MTGDFDQLHKTIILAARALGLSALLAFSSGAFLSSAHAATRHHGPGYRHSFSHAHAAYRRHRLHTGLGAGHRHLARDFDTLVEAAVGPRSAYQPATTRGQIGRASYYGGRAHTASGGVVGAATCAHRTLPFGTRVLVTNLANAAQAILTVNDRGPFVRGRIVDVSVGAAGLLGMLRSGTANVRVEVLGAHG